jgi:hypothetical protein
MSIYEVERMSTDGTASYLTHEALISSNRHKNTLFIKPQQPTVVSSPKASQCGGSIAGIAGSNPPEGTDIRPLCLLCVVSVTVSLTS